MWGIKHFLCLADVVPPLALTESTCLDFRLLKNTQRRYDIREAQEMFYAPHSILFLGQSAWQLRASLLMILKLKPWWLITITRSSVYKSDSVLAQWLVHAIELWPGNNKERSATITSCASRMSYLLWFSSGLESRLGCGFYLGRDILLTQMSLFLEVRKLLKLQGVAYLEGRFRSRSYSKQTYIAITQERSIIV